MSGGIELGLIGTSDFPAFVPGATKYFGVHDLWNRIVRGIQTPMEDWLRVAARAGNLDERQTARLYLEEFRGVAPEESDDCLVKIDQRVRPPGRPWQRYHAGDFEVFARPPLDALIIECKNRSRWAVDKWGADGSDDIDPGIFAQAQGQLEALRHDRDAWVGSELPDLDEIQVAVRVDGRTIRWFRVERDPELGGMLVEAAERFWRDYVATETPPPPDGTESADRELASRFSTWTDRLREPNDDELQLLRELRSVRLTLDEIEDERKDFERQAKILEQQIQALIGHDAGLELPGDVKAEWRDTVGRPRWKEAAAELAGRLGLSKAELQTIVDERHRGKGQRKFSVTYF